MCCVYLGHTSRSDVGMCFTGVKNSEGKLFSPKYAIASSLTLEMLTVSDSDKFRAIYSLILPISDCL